MRVLFTLALGALALAQTPKPSPLAGLMQVPVQLSFIQSGQDWTLYLSRDGRYVLEGSIHEMGRSPFQREIDLIRTEQQPAFGAPAGAPLSLVIYSDFQCPVCREEAKVLREKLPDELGSHGFRDHLDWIFEHQNEINAGNFRAKLLEWAKGKGLDTAALSRLIETRALVGEVDASVAEARRLGVTSTPTAFLNGRKLVGNIAWNSMSNIIKAELGFLGKSRSGE
jgi:protein-disulfide isomerase